MKPLLLNHISEYSEDHKEESGPLYLHAMLDLGAHLTLDAKVNSFAAQALVDSGAT